MPKKYESPYAAKPAAPPPAASPVAPMKPTRVQPPSPSILGSGMAANAGKALKSRKSRIDKAIEDAGG